MRPPAEKLMTEEQILAGNFVFISFSHKDNAAVEQDVKALHARGVRVWFDENMHLSESWKTQASKVMTHPNCRGVIFYHSKYSFVSEPCSLERKIAWEQHLKDETYGYWFVNLEGKNMDVIEQEAALLAINENRFAHYTTARDGELFKKVRGDEKDADEKGGFLYIPRKDGAACVEEIYQKIARRQGLVDDVGSVISSLEKKGIMSKDTKGMKFGVYINQKYTAPLNHEGTDGRFTADNGTEYIARDNQIYTVLPLYWKLLYVENDVAVFLCDEIIDYSKGGEDAREFLESKFYSVAFSEEEKGKLNGRLPRLLTQEDIDKNQTPSALALHDLPDPMHRHWWIDADGMMQNWKMTYCNGTPYPKGFVVSVEKGIRPVIEIPTKNLQDTQYK